MAKLIDLTALRKHGVSYNPKLTTLDLPQVYLNRIKNNKAHRFYGGRVIMEDLNLDPNTSDNIVILNNKDLLASMMDTNSKMEENIENKKNKIKLSICISTKIIKRYPRIKNI
jgi:hypothetical protein